MRRQISSIGYAAEKGVQTTVISCFKGNFSVTSPHGYRLLNGTREYHKGIDLVGLDDTTVYAIADGTVYTRYEKDGFGRYVRQHLSDGRRIYYGHLKSFSVPNGTVVRKGQALGVMGSTGKAYGAHTHLEIRPAGYTSESDDIAAFTGIPNTIGTYTYTESDSASKTEKSTDETVQNMIADGVTSVENATHWTKVLAGELPAVPAYLRAILDRYHEKSKQTKV